MWEITFPGHTKLCRLQYSKLSPFIVGRVGDYIPRPHQALSLAVQQTVSIHCRTCGRLHSQATPSFVTCSTANCLRSLQDVWEITFPDHTKLCHLQYSKPSLLIVGRVGDYIPRPHQALLLAVQQTVSVHCRTCGRLHSQTTPSFVACSTANCLHSL